VGSLTRHIDVFRSLTDTAQATTSSGLVREVKGTNSGTNEVYVSRVDYDKFGQRTQAANRITTFKFRPPPM
jgi:hypothetical protein